MELHVAAWRARLCQRGTRCQRDSHGAPRRPCLGGRFGSLFPPADTRIRRHLRRILGRRPDSYGRLSARGGRCGSASPANTGSWTEQLAAREARLKRRHQRLRAALHTLMAEEEARMQALAASMDYLLAAQAARQAWLRVRMLEWGC